jgi:hypothetical protein
VFPALALFHLDLKVVASFAEIALDAASNSYEPAMIAAQPAKRKK